MVSVSPLIARREVRFLIVGASAALLLFMLNYALARAGVPPMLAGSVAYAIAFVIAYLVQRGWTFGARHAHRNALPRYLAVQLVCAFMNGLVSYVAVHDFSQDALVMSAVATVISSATSFVLSSLWAFSEGTAEKPGL